MLIYLVVIVQLALLSNAQASVSSSDSAASALTLSSWASTLMCSSAAVGRSQVCTPNIEDGGSYLDFRMLANFRASVAFNVELATEKSAALLRSSWLRPLYDGLSTVASAAAQCDSASVTGLFGTQLSDAVVSASFSPWSAGTCNVSSLDAALAHVSVSYKERSPARISSYISMRSGSSRVHAANSSQLPPAFDTRILPLATGAHGARTFVFLVDGSFTFDHSALRLLVQASIQLIGSSDLLQMIWATSSGPAMPLCRHFLSPALASADLKRCLLKMSRDMVFSGVAQLMASMSMAEEIVSAHDGGRKVEIVLFGSSSSPVFPFEDIYQGTGCIGRSSSSPVACPYRSMLDLGINSTSKQEKSLIIHSVIVAPDTSTRYPAITCRTTGAAVFVHASLCSESRFKCTSALSPVFMTVSRDFVEFAGGSAMWLPADEMCSLRLQSGLPLSCAPTLSHLSFVSNSSGANVIAGISSAELHATELYDVLRDVVANVSLNIHGLVASNVELLLVHVASGVVLGSSHLSTLSPNKDAKWKPDSRAHLPTALLENGFRNFLPCCSGISCRCATGQPNQLMINEVAVKYQIPSKVLKFQNVTCGSAAPGVVACSQLLDTNVAVVVIAKGRRTVPPASVLLSAEQVPNFASFAITVLPAALAAAAMCPSKLFLPQAAQLIGAKPACAQLFRSDSSVQFCRGNISIHYSPCSWRSSFAAIQGLDDSQSRHLRKFLAGQESSQLLPFSGLHPFAMVGSAVSYGLMQTAVAPLNVVLSIFFGYRQGVFASAPARTVPPAFDHTITDWFANCASIPYSTANSNDPSIFPVWFVILPLRQSFAALSAQRALPPVLVIARPAYYPPSMSQESDNDNFVGVFGVEIDIPSFSSVLNQNKMCSADGSNCVLTDQEGWIIMDRHLQEPLTAMAAIQQQHMSSEELDFQRPLRWHLSQQYNELYRELLARGIARSSSASAPWRVGITKETVSFRIHLPSLPAVFELVNEGLTVSVALLPGSNAVFFVLATASAETLNSASSFGCALSISLDRLQPLDFVANSAALAPNIVLRQTFARDPYPTDMAAVALPWASQWSSAVPEVQYAWRNVGAAAPHAFDVTSIVDNAEFFMGSLDMFTVHPCESPGLPLSAILAGVLAVFGLLLLLVLMFKHFQAVRRLFNVTVLMSLHPRNLSYSLYLLSKVEVAQRAVSGVTVFDNVLHLSSASAQPAAAPSDATEKRPPAAAANMPDWEREGRVWGALEAKLNTAIDESEYSAALKELCSVSIMSSFMNASLLLASLSEYNAATRAQIWPCVDMVRDSESALSARLQRLEMTGVVLVGIQTMIEKLQSRAEKSEALNTKMQKSTGGSSLEFLQRHYSAALSPQLEHARNVQVARRLIATALATSPSVAAAEVASRLESGIDPAAAAAEEDLQYERAVDELSLESARSCSSQAGGYFVDPSVITVPSGSISSATITLRLNAAGRHEQQASIWRRAYLGRLHREIQGDTPPSSNISSENWALIALRAHASQRGHVHADDPDQLLLDLPNSSAVTLPANANPSPIRARARKDQHADGGVFGISLAVAKSSGVAQSSTGLGAALLTVFNDIVADDSSRSHENNLATEIHISNGAGEFEEEVQVEVSSEDSSFSMNRENVANTVSCEDDSEFQDDPVSVYLHPPEHLVTSTSLQPSPLDFETVSEHSLFGRAPPVRGVATPRRAKAMSLGQNPQKVHPFHSLSASDHKDIQPDADQEMDM